MDTVKDFIAVQIIYQIDDIMAMTVTDCPAKKGLKDDPLMVSNVSSARPDYLLYEKYEKEKLHPCSQLLLFFSILVQRILSIIFVVYYYFAPLLVLALFIWKSQFEFGFEKQWEVTN